MRVRPISPVMVAVVAGLAMSACGNDGRPAGSESAAPTVAASTPEFGDGCAAVPLDPANPGSFEAMASKPVASALAGNAALSVLAEAVKRAGLEKAWNAAPAVTVFAPTDRAFEKLPTGERERLLGDRKALARVLTYHVLPQRLAASDLAGTHRTMQGGDVVVEIRGSAVTVNASAAVLCGNVQTKNGTVYIVDAVLSSKP